MMDETARALFLGLCLGALLLAYAVDLFRKAGRMAPIWAEFKADGVAVPWAVAAVVGFGCLCTGIALEISDGFTTWWSVGGAIAYFAGAIPWVFFVGTDYEAPLLGLAAGGVVVWATGSAVGSEPLKTAMLAAAAVYLTLGDMVWYKLRGKTGTESSGLLGNGLSREWIAGWHGVLAMVHYAFAFYVAAETTVSENAFEPGVELTFNQWLRLGGSDQQCGDTTDCVVYAVSSPPVRLSIGFVAAAFSWISGSHHLVMYAGLANNSAWATDIAGFNKYPCGNWLRALDYGTSAPLMLACIVILFETPASAATVCAFIVAMSLVVAVGYASEALWGVHINDNPNTQTRAASRWLFGAATVLFLLLWTPLAGIVAYIYTTGWQRYSGPRLDFVEIADNVWNATTAGEQCLGNLPEASKPPLLVGFIVAWLFASFCLFPIVHAYRLWGDSGGRRAVEIELAYMVCSFFSKLPLLAVISGGLVGRRNTRTPDEQAESADDTETQMAIGIGAGIAVLLGILLIGSTWWRASRTGLQL